MLRILFWFVFYVSAGAATAQENHSSKCDPVQNSVEKLICDNPKLTKLNHLVAARYADALDVTKSLDAGAKDAEQELEAHQQSWISGRDDCLKSDDPKSCILSSYERREAELVALYMLEEPTAVATWQCGDSPANELVTSFFETESSGVRMERGGKISFGWLAMTASGSRYDGDLGESIWMKGDEAQYWTPDPNGVELNCIVISQ